MLSSIKFILIFIVLIIKCYLHLPQTETLNGFWHYWHYFWFTTTWQGGHVGGKCKMVFSSQRPFPEERNALGLGHQQGRCDVTCKKSNTLSLNDNKGSILASILCHRNKWPGIGLFPISFVEDLPKTHNSFLNHINLQCNFGSSHWSPLDLLLYTHVHKGFQWLEE